MTFLKGEESEKRQQPKKIFFERDAQNSSLNQNDVGDENFSLSVIVEREAEEEQERRATTITR